MIFFWTQAGEMLSVQHHIFAIDVRPRITIFCSKHLSAFSTSTSIVGVLWLLALEAAFLWVAGEEVTEPHCHVTQSEFVAVGRDQLTVTHPHGCQFGTFVGLLFGVVTVQVRIALIQDRAYFTSKQHAGWVTKTIMNWVPYTGVI